MQVTALQRLDLAEGSWTFDQRGPSLIERLLGKGVRKGAEVGVVSIPLRISRLVRARYDQSCFGAVRDPFGGGEWAVLALIMRVGAFRKCTFMGR